MKLKNLFEKDVYKQGFEKVNDYDFDELVDDSYKEYGTYQNLKKSVAGVLSTLTPREERVLRYRFGINLDKDYTLEELAKMFGVSRERIRDIETKALRKLKHPSRSRKLRSYLDPDIVVDREINYDKQREEEEKRIQYIKDQTRKWLEQHRKKEQ